MEKTKETLKIFLNFSENQPLTIPSEAEEKVRSIIKTLENSKEKEKEITLTLHPEDYFLTRFLFLYKKKKSLLPNKELRIFSLNLETNQWEEYEDFYALPISERVLD